MKQLGRQKNKITKERINRFRDQMELFNKHRKLAFVKIRGYETSLIISSDGVLYRLRDGYIELVKPYLEKDGHLRYSIKINKKDVKEYIHKMVAIAFIPNPENKPEVHHIDGDELNNDVTNLMWVTRKEHALLTKQLNQYKSNKGSFSGKSAKYTDEQIEKACTLIQENKLYPEEICKCSGISYSVFQHILHKEDYWDYITSKYDLTKYNKFKRAVYTTEQKNDFIRLRINNPEYTLKKISEILDIRYEAIKNWNIKFKNEINNRKTLND